MPKIADELECLNTTLVRIGNALSSAKTQPAARGGTTERPTGPASVVPPVIGTEVMATLTQIAREHLGILVLDNGTLDPLDCYEVAATSVAVALRAAYEAGFAAGVSETAH